VEKAKSLLESRCENCDLGDEGAPCTCFDAMGRANELLMATAPTDIPKLTRAVELLSAALENTIQAIEGPARDFYEAKGVTATSLNLRSTLAEVEGLGGDQTK
jgi:hypothetical protein